MRAKWKRRKLESRKRRKKSEIMTTKTTGSITAAKGRSLTRSEKYSIVATGLRMQFSCLSQGVLPETIRKRHDERDVTRRELDLDALQAVFDKDCLSLKQFIDVAEKSTGTSLGGQIRYPNPGRSPFYDAIGDLERVLGSYDPKKRVVALFVLESIGKQIPFDTKSINRINRIFSEEVASEKNSSVRFAAKMAAETIALYRKMALLLATREVIDNGRRM